MIEAEALQKIQDTARKAAEVQVVHVAGEDKLVWLAQDGKHESHQLPPDPRRHTVEALDDLVAAAQHFEATSIWVSETEVVAIIDRDRRRDRVTWPLVYTDQFKAVLECREGPLQLDQREIVRWLKVTMWRCVEDETLVPAISNLEWKRREEGHGQIDGGRQSVGKSIEAEVASRTARLPDTFALSVRVHENREEEFEERIVLSLEPDVVRQVFLVQALPQEIARAIERRTKSIADRIGESVSTDLPVWFGSP